MVVRRPAPIDLHAKCPPPIWHGTEWRCHNHQPNQVVQKAREPNRAPVGHATPGGQAAVAAPVVKAPAPQGAPEAAAPLDELQGLRKDFAPLLDGLQALRTDFAALQELLIDESASEADIGLALKGQELDDSQSLVASLRAQLADQSSEAETRLVALVSALESPAHRRERNRWRFYHDNKSEWRWQLKDTNGNTLGDSNDGYKNLKDIQANAGRHGWDEAQTTEVEKTAE